MSGPDLPSHSPRPIPLFYPHQRNKQCAEAENKEEEAALCVTERTLARPNLLPLCFGRSHTLQTVWNSLEMGKQADSRISSFIQQKFCGKQFGHVDVPQTTITLFLNPTSQSSDSSLLPVPPSQSWEETAPSARFEPVRQPLKRQTLRQTCHP